MTSLREAAQMALDGIVLARIQATKQSRDEMLNEIAEALRARLAQTEQEPVAWMFQNEETGLTECVDVQQIEWGFEKNNPRWQKIGPLYTDPPQREWKYNPMTGEPMIDGWPLYSGLPQRAWQGLTDEEINNLAAIKSGMPLYRAIEQAIKEKNT